MYGHWESQTRKLNRHYQSVKELIESLLRDGERGYCKLSVKDKNPFSLPLKKGINITLKIGGNNMYITSKSTKVTKVHTEKMGRLAEGDWYFSDVVNLVNTDGVSIENLYDVNGLIEPSQNLYLGFQAQIFVYRRKEGEYGPDAEIDAADYNRYGQRIGRLKQCPEFIINNLKFKYQPLSNINGVSTNSKTIKYGNKEILNMKLYMQVSPAININTLDATLSVGFKDEDVEQGLAINEISSPYAIEKDGHFMMLCPTIYDSNGNIYEFK